MMLILAAYICSLKTLSASCLWDPMVGFKQWGIYFAHNLKKIMKNLEFFSQLVYI